jgi:hypothetical protein
MCTAFGGKTVLALALVYDPVAKSDARLDVACGELGHALSRSTKDYQTVGPHTSSCCPFPLWDNRLSCLEAPVRTGQFRAILGH